MVVKLNTKLYNYIENTLLKEKEYLKAKLEVSKQQQQLHIFLDEDTSDEIRDWASERQQILGFDEEYNLNQEGEILDELINVFYIDIK